MEKEIKVAKVMDHYEVYIGDEFVCSGDTFIEAVKEAEKMGKI